MSTESQPEMNQLSNTEEVAPETSAEQPQPAELQDEEQILKPKGADEVERELAETYETQLKPKVAEIVQAVVDFATERKQILRFQEMQKQNLAKERDKVNNMIDIVAHNTLGKDTSFAEDIKKIFASSTSVEDFQNKMIATRNTLSFFNRGKKQMIDYIISEEKTLGHYDQALQTLHVIDQKLETKFDTTAYARDLYQIMLHAWKLQKAQNSIGRGHITHFPQKVYYLFKKSIEKAVDTTFGIQYALTKESGLEKLVDFPDRFTLQEK